MGKYIRGTGWKMGTVVGRDGARDAADAAATAVAAVVVAVDGGQFSLSTSLEIFEKNILKKIF
jgi:hypothetical protein